MREFGKIITRKTDLTDAQVQEKYKFPAIIILHDNEDQILKITHYQKNGTKTVYDFSQSASKQFVTDSIATAIAGLQDNRLEFNEFSDFPAIGDVSKFYIDLTNDRIYIWNATSSTYKNQSWDTAIIASIQASIASAQMAFQNLENSKQNKLTEDNVGEFMDLELSTKSAPTSGDTVLGRDSVTGKAVEIPTDQLGGNVDTSNLVPYNGATKDVNIASNYFKTSKGFDFTKDENNFFKSFSDGEVAILEFISKDNTLVSTYFQVNPEEFTLRKQDNSGLNVNIFFVTNEETFSLKPFISESGFKTPTGTANQSLTANGGVFDLNTKADLDGGKVPAWQLPSYVDDVLEFANLASFPATGESGKIYIAIDTNLTYRWGGSSYVVMSSSLALGETSSTAYRGDRGKIAYDHSQVVGNPHGTTKTDIGLGNVPNIDATNPTNIVQTSSYRFVTDSEKTNLSTAYNHSQATGNPHNTKVEELTDVSGDATTIIDTDVILKKEIGGLWKKITFANFKNWFTTELAKKINIGVDTVFNFKNISAMTLTQFKALTPNLETIYFTEEQNATGWQQIRYNGLGISIPATTETKVSITDENYIELDSDSSFNLIDVANTKINGIFEKDFVIIKFNAGVITPATANQWFKVILKINGVQTAVSPVFYLTETSGTVEQIAHNFALNVPAEMVTNGATLHLKTSATMTFNNPAISVVRVHKSTNANL